MTILTTTVDSPIGPLVLSGTEGALSGLYLTDGAHNPTDMSGWTSAESAFRSVAEQLEAYFDGDLKEFEVTLDLHGTQFQRRVWSALQTVPYGTTTSYAAIARQVGSPTAYRAVGLANGRNPVAVIVPCHRVIGANGTLTGYGGGLERKRLLLDLESGVLPLLSLAQA
jgi:methylated-DNA-[protein]-cysteine S-methyltransferase